MAFLAELQAQITALEERCTRLEEVFQNAKEDAVEPVKTEEVKTE